MILSNIPMDKGSLLKLTRDLIREAGLKPSKRLGQHFTIDPRLIEELGRLARSFGCFSEEPLIEVGTGFGIVTRYLATLCPRIITVEIDERIYNIAKRMLEGLDNVYMILGDALEVLENINFTGVVGTIPYSITGPLLGSVARSNAKWAVLVLQKDVVDRIKSPPGTKSYGSIGVMLNIAFSIDSGNIYAPQSFYPEPAVFSQTLILRRKEPRVMVEKELEEFIKCIFSQRKRLAHKAIKSCTDVEIQRTSTRVFQMTPEEIYRIYNTVKIEKQSRARTQS
ncbi:MAG TPA: rRNA adenine N-6-methyltransferase family protein [Sulfolobales archaeon]|nr:rRNA adenine N-6-methyltransferase family protein [Sulfolobales archaeon]